MTDTTDQINTDDIAFDITDEEILELVLEFIQSGDKRAAVLDLLDTYGRPRSTDEILQSQNEYRTTLEYSIRKLPGLVRDGKMSISSSSIPYLASKHQCSADELQQVFNERGDLKDIFDEATHLSKSKQAKFWKKK